MFLTFGNGDNDGNGTMDGNGYNGGNGTMDGNGDNENNYNETLAASRLAGAQTHSYTSY